MVALPSSVIPEKSSLKVEQHRISVHPHLINGRTSFSIRNKHPKAENLWIKFAVSPHTVEGSWSFFLLGDHEKRERLLKSYQIPFLDLMIPADGQEYVIDVIFSVPNPDVYTITMDISEVTSNKKLEDQEIRIRVEPY
ncbi:unnamed protein product, partial [Mesorhabditis belari]|uniref:Uncharacterized protein n=1 Tax=Mesorhabditis belari TaxID=2138241 RepID=A0AAF3EER5_9BILA